jgi:putative sugar O-methyltransferase
MLDLATDLTPTVLANIDDMYRALADETLEDGHFWQQLGEQHRQMIASSGFANFKRTINFQYGQWGISTYLNRFTARLLFALFRRGRIPKIARVDHSSVDNIRWKQGPATPERLNAYAFYCGLLWQYAEALDAINGLRSEEPALGNPMPVRLGTRLISQDLAMASLSLNLIAKFAPIRSVGRVLEIGAGYGRIAYLVGLLLPVKQYVIVDIPPTLAVSQNYLATIFGEDKVERFSRAPALSRTFNFLLPHQIAVLPDDHFDLVVNFSSFDEMPSQTVLSYLKLIDRVCSGHLYLGGYAHPEHEGDFLGLDEFPYSQTWQQMHNCKHEIFNGFVEKVFKIR